MTCSDRIILDEKTRVIRADTFQCPTNEWIKDKCSKFIYPSYYQNPDDCYSYIECEFNINGDYGEPVVRVCPPGTIWNADMRRCNFRDTWQCKQ